MARAEADPRIRELAENFDINDPAMSEHPERLFEVFEVMRETCPVAHSTPAGGQPSWALTGYDDCFRVFRNDEDFSSQLAGDADPVVTDNVPFDEVDRAELTRMSFHIPIAIDPPTFFMYRRFMNPLFSPQKAQEREPLVRTIAGELIAGFIGSGATDLHEQFARPLPARLTCRILGLPEERWEYFANPVDAIAHPDNPDELDMGDPAQLAERGYQLMADFNYEILKIAEERRQDPRDDVLTYLVNATIDDGRPLSPYEIVGIATLILGGGVETTTSAIGSGLVYFGRNPEVRDQLIERPELIESAVEEVLRMWPPISSFGRRARNTVAVNGVEIPAGDTVLMMLGGANRDPRQFPSPDEFVLERSPNRHLTFTAGIHRCIGSNLARMQIKVAFQEILARLPHYELDESGVNFRTSTFGYGYRAIPVTFA
jgi:cytochrome P450